MGEVYGFLGLGLGFLSILGGLGIVFYAISLTSKGREMRHRERMAMIEKGLVPPAAAEYASGDAHPVRRRRASGIMMIGVGIGLMIMLGASRSDWTGVGVGGFVAMMGVASVISAHLDERERRAAQPPASTAQGPM